MRKILGEKGELKMNKKQMMVCIVFALLVFPGTYLLGLSIGMNADSLNFTYLVLLGCVGISAIFTVIGVGLYELYKKLGDKKN